MNLGTSVDLVESSVNKLHVFPNPSKNFVNISLENNLPSELILMDISGKILLEKTFTNSSKINLSNFNNGIYFLKISNNSQITTKRINVVK